MFELLLAPHKNHLSDCLEKNLFSEKRVLEVGGAIPKDVTRQLNVKCWHCVDPAFEESVDFRDDYKHIKASILDYKPDKNYDFIIATNSFEHIINLHDAVDVMYNLLNENGTLSSLLGPIWSSYKGHHVWLVDDVTVTFNDIKLPDWAHLLYSPEELRDILYKSYDKIIVDKLMHQLVDWDFLNKLFYDDYIEIINNSKFKINELRDWHTSKYPPENIQKILEEKYNKKNFSTVSLKMILKK